jgi:hypothetical protein
MVMKFRKACTWELFISQMFNYGKLAFLFLFGLVDYRLTVYYAIYCLVLWLVLTNPKYDGPSKIKRLQTTNDFLEFIHRPGSTIPTTLKETTGYTLNQK